MLKSFDRQYSYIRENKSLRNVESNNSDAINHRILALKEVVDVRDKLMWLDMGLGCEELLKIAEKDRLRFTILSSMLLIACPAVIEFVFNKLTVVLN